MRRNAWFAAKRLVAAVLVAGAASTAVATTGALPAAAMAGRRSGAGLGELPSGRLAMRELAVAVVIDFGPTAGISPTVLIKCLHVRPGTNGTDVLVSVLHEVHAAAPTYNDSGLLCSIAGYPHDGCGTFTASGYAYWSYWHGGTSWSYANVGPAEWTLPDLDVEGWRFEPHGHASPADPPPTAPSSLAAACMAQTTGSISGVVQPAGTSSETVVLLGLVGLLVVALGVVSVLRWRRPADE